MNHLKPVVSARAGLNRRVRKCLFVLLALIFMAAPVAAEPVATPEWLPALLEKESVTIVITD